MKKNNKAFTLLELISTIALIAIISLVATVTYNKIRKDITQRQYENLKSLIETAAIKYTAKNGYYTYFVQDLIDAGLVETDDETDVYDPRDDSSLNCHVIYVKDLENGTYEANLSDEDYKENGKCNYSKVDVYEAGLKIIAKIEGTNVDYTSTTTNTPYIFNGWTKYNLDLTADVFQIEANENLDGAKYVWNKNSDNTTNEPNRSFTTNEYGVYSGNYYLDLYPSSGSNYQAKLMYKFDNEKPVLYKDDKGIKVVDETKYDKWTTGKTLLFYATDKNGSGLSRIYIGRNDCSLMLTDTSMGTAAVPGLVQTYEILEEVGEEFEEFNVCITDKAGNLTEDKYAVNKIDRTAPVGLTLTGYKRPTSDSMDLNQVLQLETIESDTWYKGWEAVVPSGATDDGSGEIYYLVSTTGATTNVTDLKRTWKGVDAEGISTVIYKACDAVGNCSAPESFIVKLDRTKPTIPSSVLRYDSNSGTVRTNADSWTNRTLWWGSYSATDSYSGVNHYEYSSGCNGNKTNNLNNNGYTYSQNWNAKYCIRAVDNVGNEGDWSSPVYIKVDKTPPSKPTLTGYAKTSSANASSTSGLSTIASGTWTNKYLYIVASGSTDTGGSGLQDKPYYLVTVGQGEGTDCNETDHVCNQSGRNVNTQGVVTVKYKACDKAGNCSDYTTYTSKEDRVAPSAPTVIGYQKTSSDDASSSTGLSTIASNTWTKSYLFVQASGSTDYSTADKSQSGVGGIKYYLVTQGQSTDANDSQQSGRNVNTPGTVTVKYKACDSLNNCSSYTSFISKQDRTIYCGTSSGGSTSWTSSNRTITQNCNDKYPESGGTTLSGCVNASYSKTFSTSAKTGTITIKDNVGNSKDCTVNVYVDKETPTSPKIYNNFNQVWTNSPYKINLESTDNYSGIQYFQYTYSSSATTTGTDNTKNWVTYGSSGTTSSGSHLFTTTEFSAERNSVVYFRACDNVGHCSGKEATTVMIDKTAPTITHTNSGSTHTFTCTDSRSGVVNAALSIKVDGTATGTRQTGSNSSIVTWNATSGNHTVTALCYDKAGNATTSTFTINDATTSGTTTVKCQNGYGNTVTNPSTCSNGYVQIKNLPAQLIFGCNSLADGTNAPAGFSDYIYKYVSKTPDKTGVNWFAHSTYCSSTTGYCKYVGGKIYGCNKWNTGAQYLSSTSMSSETYYCCN